MSHLGGDEAAGDEGANLLPALANTYERARDSTIDALGLDWRIRQGRKSIGEPFSELLKDRRAVLRKLE